MANSPASPATRRFERTSGNRRSVVRTSPDSTRGESRVASTAQAIPMAGKARRKRWLAGMAGKNRRKKSGPPAASAPSDPAR